MSEEKQLFNKKAYDREYNKAKRGHILFEYAIEKDYKTRIKTIATQQKLSVNGWIAQIIDKALAQSEAQQQGYYRDNFEQIIVRYFKTKKLKSRIKPLADADGISLDRWILNTIEEKLQTVESDPASDH